MKRKLPSHMVTNLEKYTPEPNSGCWLWTGRMMTSGYGQVVRGGKNKLAHREMWERERGPIPDSLCVLHKCDVRCCVNPDHLFLGTQADNMRDMDAKGRRSPPPRNDLRGSRHPLSRLTADQVSEIKRSTEMQKDLAARFGVSHAAICRIKNNLRYRDVA